MTCCSWRPGYRLLVTLQEHEVRPVVEMLEADAEWARRRNMCHTRSGRAQLAREIVCGLPIPYSMYERAMGGRK